MNTNLASRIGLTAACSLTALLTACGTATLPAQDVVDQPVAPPAQALICPAPPGASLDTVERCAEQRERAERADAKRAAQGHPTQPGQLGDSGRPYPDGRP